VWLFVGSDDGGAVNAIFTSLLASCGLCGVEPWSYLRDIFCLLPQWSEHRLLDLAPVALARSYWLLTSAYCLRQDPRGATTSSASSTRRRDFTVKELTDDRRAVCHERAEDVVLGKEPVLHQELRAAVEVFAGFTDKGEARPTRTTRARGVNLGPLRTLRPMSISPPSEWRSTWRPRRPSRAHAYVDDRRSSARPG
jgi:hypothetical protein